jgi:hypothetical protein
VIFATDPLEQVSLENLQRCFELLWTPGMDKIFIKRKVELPLDFQLRFFGNSQAITMNNPSRKTDFFRLKVPPLFT